MRILVADDSPVIRQMVLRLLSREGHEVSLAEDGRLVTEQIQQHSFDLVFLDIYLAELDGFATTRTIRTLSGAGARVPIIALVSDESPALEQQCRSVGMDGCLGKPVTRTHLLRVIDEWCDRTTRCAAAPCRPDMRPVWGTLPAFPNLRLSGSVVFASGMSDTSADVISDPTAMLPDGAGEEEGEGEDPRDREVAVRDVLWLSTSETTNIWSTRETQTTLAKHRLRQDFCSSAMAALRLLAEAAERGTPYAALVIDGDPSDMAATALTRLIARFYCLGVAQVLFYRPGMAEETRALIDDISLPAGFTNVIDSPAQLISLLVTRDQTEEMPGLEASGDFETMGYDPFDLGNVFDDENENEDLLAWVDEALFDHDQHEALLDALGTEELSSMLVQLDGQLATFLANIRVLLARGERQAAGDIAHTLKGVAGNMGARRVFVGARTLMALLRSGDTDIDMVLYELLLQALDAAIKATAAADITAVIAIAERQAQK